MWWNTIHKGGGELYLINEQGSQVIKESSLCDRGLRQLCVLNQTNLRSNQPIYAGLGGKSKVQLQLSSLVEGCLGVSRASGRILPSTVPRFLYGTTVTWAYSRPRWPHWTSWPLSQATKAEARTIACTDHSQREEPLSNACLTQSPKGKVDRQDGWTRYDRRHQIMHFNQF